MPDPSTAPGAPRWVKVSVGAALVVVALVAVLLLVGGGDHGPGRHTGSGSDGAQTTPAAGPEGHKPPEGAHP